MLVDLTEEELRFLKILLLNKDLYATDSEKTIISILNQKFDKS
jgi:hypothetical protein